jgi:hypothetical protein
LEQKKTDPDGNREDINSEENDIVVYESIREGDAQWGAHDGQTSQEGMFPLWNELFDILLEFLTATFDPLYIAHFGGSRPIVTALDFLRVICNFIAKIQQKNGVLWRDQFRPVRTINSAGPMLPLQDFPAAVRGFFIY